MNILIFNWRDIKNEWAGGGEVYMFELAKRWVKMGHTVTLFCGQNIREKLPDTEDIDGIKIYRKGGRYTLYLWACFYYFKFLRHKCDVVVDVQNGIPFFTTLYSRKPKIGIVYHIHGKQFFMELLFPLNLVGYAIEKVIFPFFYQNTKIIAISDTTRQELLELGFNKKNIEIVYCGIDKKQPHESTPGKFIHPTILYLGRIKKYKRVDFLIKIMPLILAVVPQARLIIAGWGTEASTIADMSMRSRERRKVKLIGPVTEGEKRKLLSKAWVFVNPSIGEGWGISVIEANMQGTPAVAFQVKGLSESIKDGVTGYLAENEEEFIEHVTSLLRNTNKRVLMGKRASAWAKTFNWDTAAKRSLNILVKVTKN